MKWNPLIYMVKTTRNSVLPLAIREWASFSLSRGYFSIMGRMPVSSAKRRVPSESVGIPEAQPWMRLLPKRIFPGGTSTTILPLGPIPWMLHYGRSLGGSFVFFPSGVLGLR